MDLPGSMLLRGSAALRESICCSRVGWWGMQKWVLEKVNVPSAVYNADRMFLLDRAAGRVYAPGSTPTQWPSLEGHMKNNSIEMLRDKKSKPSLVQLLHDRLVDREPELQVREEFRPDAFMNAFGTQ